MVLDKAQIKGKLRTELAILTLTLNGNTEKVNQLTQTFLDETTLHFELLREAIEKGSTDNLLALLHKLKPRYSYLGLDNLMDEMSQWEREVGVVSSTEKNLERINYFESMNELISTELNEIKLEQTLKSSAEQTTLPLTGKKVLIAEDDEVNAMVFELFIEELGGTVLKATDGNEAVRLTNEHNPDLIFMDVHMPYFSGVEAIKLIRSKNLAIPIISLSASTRLHEKQQSLDAGATSFLTKPAKREAIQQVLLQYLKS
jgi:CheY-like chemotaxis protein/HPt (histidine-containing phosphotransfer) domain-containing protein